MARDSGTPGCTVDSALHTGVCAGGDDKVMTGSIRPAFVLGVAAMIAVGLHTPLADAQDRPDTEGKDDALDATPQETEELTPREKQMEKRFKTLEEKYEALEQRMETESVERMVQDAENEARAGQEEASPEEREFLEGGLSLQKLNPEISFYADVVAGIIINEDHFYASPSDRSGMWIREVGLTFQHVLDPYSNFKAAINFIPEPGAERLEVEEVYVSWFGVIPSFSFSVGRFRQNFGIVNRWHGHDLDQTQYPLAMEQVLGEGGLSGDGFVVKWLMPSLWAHVNELTLEVVDGSNETLFSGEHFSIPSTMLHLKNYYDLNESTYLGIGGTGMFGFNNRRGALDEEEQMTDEPWRTTWVAGADMTLFWSPLQRARYRSFTWRSEFYYAAKELPASATADARESWGAYSYIQIQLAERWFMGMRGDIALPTERDSNELTWDAVPYLTFWQSEFVFFRLEYAYGREIPYEAAGGTIGRHTDNRVLLQIDFAAGPHKHEKY